MRDQTHLTQVLELQDLPYDQHRTYLAVFAEPEGSGIDVVISGGTMFHIEEGSNWGPMPAPMNDIEFTGEGILMFTGTKI